MKNKITHCLVLLLSLSLSPTFGQSSDKDDKIHDNSIESYGSIERNNTFDLRLDSLIGRNGENRLLYRWSYDKNKITEEAFTIVGNKITPRRKIERLYNDKGLVKVEFNYDWKEVLKQYQPSGTANRSKTEFIYDDSGNNLFQYQYFWSTNKESFLPYDKEEFKFNEQGNKILRFWYTWNSELEKFDVATKTEYKYDIAGKIIESNWYNYKSYKNDYRDEFFLERKYIFTYNEFLDCQYRQLYYWDNDAGKLQLSNNGEVRYSFKENKKFSIKNHIWEAEILKNKNDSKRVIYSPSFIKMCENDISTARTSSNREFKYNDYGICILYNRFSVNKVTNTKYKKSIRARTILVEDENNLVYHYTDSDYDLDFYNWEIDKEWYEYYSKIEN